MASNPRSRSHLNADSTKARKSAVGIMNSSSRMVLAWGWMRAAGEIGWVVAGEHSPMYLGPATASEAPALSPSAVAYSAQSDAILGAMDQLDDAV